MKGTVCALCFVLVFCAVLCAATPFRDMVAGGCVGVAAVATVVGAPRLPIDYYLLQIVMLTMALSINMNYALRVMHSCL